MIINTSFIAIQSLSSQTRNTPLDQDAFFAKSVNSFNLNEDIKDKTATINEAQSSLPLPFKIHIKEIVSPRPGNMGIAFIALIEDV